MSIKLLKSTAVVSFMTLISRISGLARDVVFAVMFGATGVTDAFFIAFKIPNFLRRLFAEGAFAQAFVPVFTEYKTQRELADVQELTKRVSGTLGAVLFMVTAIGILAAPWLVMAFAPGFIDDQPRLDLTAHMLRITFPYILFISLTALATGVLNSYGQFAIPSITPVLLNLVLIGTAVWMSPYFEQPVIALAWGVFIAGFVQLVFQFPSLIKLKLLSWPRWDWKDAGVVRIARLMLPAIVGSSAQQINLLFDILISSFLVGGSISWLYYADRLVEFPLGVFGIAIATVILPSLSAKFAQSDPEKFTQTMDWGVRWALVIGTPAMVGLIVLAGPLVATIFQHGKFNAHHVLMTEYALMAYAIGLMGYIYVKVLAPGYYSRQNTKTPMKYSVISIGVKMTLTIIFVPTMVTLDFIAPHVGLALSTSCAALVNAFLLYRGLHRDGVYKPLPGWLPLIFKVCLASATLVVVLMWFVSFDNSVWQARSTLMRAWYLTLWVSVGGAVYFAVLYMLRVDFKALLRHAD